jgi:hypothetical protein
MQKKKLSVIAAGAALALTIGGVAYAGLGDHRDPVAFFTGHTHAEDGTAIGAPSHSGGTDRNGCHNASVPYHCH